LSDLAAIILIALTLLGEARGQPPNGQACLAHTIVNRMAISGWTAEEVLFQPYQYRVWGYGRIAPGYAFRMKWLRGMALGEFPHNPWFMEPVLMIGPEEDWAKVLEIATRVYNGEVPPPGCERVTNYDNLRFWGGEPPPWAADMTLGTCIADHCFYSNGRVPKGGWANANIFIRMRSLRAQVRPAETDG
jgi:hypothetical protein